MDNFLPHEQEKLSHVLMYIGKTFYSQATAQDVPIAASARMAEDAATRWYIQQGRM